MSLTVGDIVEVVGDDPEAVKRYFPETRNRWKVSSVLGPRGAMVACLRGMEDPKQRRNVPLSDCRRLKLPTVIR